MSSNIDIYDAFIAAGAPEDKARAAASAILEQSNVATKLDIARLEGKIESRIADLETRMTWKVIVIVSILNGILFALLKFT